MILVAHMYNTCTSAYVIKISAIEYSRNFELYTALHSGSSLFEEEKNLSSQNSMTRAMPNSFIKVITSLTFRMDQAIYKHIHFKFPHTEIFVFSN